MYQAWGKFDVKLKIAVGMDWLASASPLHFLFPFALAKNIPISGHEAQRKSA
jgi:hypothetical protein